MFRFQLFCRFYTEVFHFHMDKTVKIFQLFCRFYTYILHRWRSHHANLISTLLQILPEVWSIVDIYIIFQLFCRFYVQERGPGLGGHGGFQLFCRFYIHGELQNKAQKDISTLLQILHEIPVLIRFYDLPLKFQLFCRFYPRGTDYYVHVWLQEFQLFCRFYEQEKDMVIKALRNKFQLFCRFYLAKPKSLIFPHINNFNSFVDSTLFTDLGH